MHTILNATQNDLSALDSNLLKSFKERIFGLLTPISGGKRWQLSENFYQWSKWMCTESSLRAKQPTNIFVAN